MPSIFKQIHPLKKVTFKRIPHQKSIQFTGPNCRNCMMHAAMPRKKVWNKGNAMRKFLLQPFGSLVCAKVCWIFPNLHLEYKVIFLQIQRNLWKVRLYFIVCLKFKIYGLTLKLEANMKQFLQRFAEYFQFFMPKTLYMLYLFRYKVISLKVCPYFRICLKLKISDLIMRFGGNILKSFAKYIFPNLNVEYKVISKSVLYFRICLNPD